MNREDAYAKYSTATIIKVKNYYSVSGVYDDNPYEEIATFVPNKADAIAIATGLKMYAEAIKLEGEQIDGIAKRNDKEHREQAALFRWAALYACTVPELRLMFAIPNGGARHIAVAAKLKAEGVKAGVPDIFLPVARGSYHGLFIEMKAGKNKPTDTQKQWAIDLMDQGYKCALCYSWDEAKDTITAYLATGA